MHVLILGLLVNSLLIQSSPVPKKSDREQAGFVGKVRVVRIEMARISKEGDKWKEGPRFSPSVMVYDTEGRMVGQLLFAEPDKMIGKSVYSYNAEGHRVEKRFSVGGTVQDFKEIAKHDSNGNWIEKSLYASDGRLLQKFGRGRHRIAR